MKIAWLVACLRAVLRALLLALWPGSFLPNVLASKLASVPRTMLAFLPACLHHRMLVRSRPLALVSAWGSLLLLGAHAAAACLPVQAAACRGLLLQLAALALVLFMNTDAASCFLPLSDSAGG